MEFYGIPWGIRTWNSMELHGNNKRLGSCMEIAPWSCWMEFDGKISFEFCGLIKFYGVPWNAIAFLMNFHGIWWKDKIHGIHWWKHFTDHALPYNAIIGNSFNYQLKRLWPQVVTKGHTGIYYFSVIRLYIHGYLLLLRMTFFSDENYCSFLGPYNIIIISFTLDVQFLNWVPFQRPSMKISSTLQ